MSGNRRWKKSLRLDFRFENYNIVLESQTAVDITPTPTDPIETEEEYNGYYVRLTGPDKTVFYVQRLQNPFRTETEAYGNAAEDGITYERLKEPDLTFSMLIPDPGFIFTLEIINNPLQPELFFRTARQTFTFTIDPAEVILPPIAVAARVENGTILGKEKIVDHGNDSECWTIAIIAEGYRADEMPKFLTDTDKFLTFFKNFSPFNEFWEKTNVYIVKIASTDSGADLPAQCQGGAPPVDVRTYLNASFCGALNTKRLLVVDKPTAKKVWTNWIPQAHVAFAMVNSGIYGGSGGEIAVFSTNPLSPLIGVHELGHSFFKLADEYETPYIDDNPDNYPNLTSRTVLSQIKWADLIAPSTPVPTSRNQCAGGGPFSHPMPDGTVGLFEGGLYKSCSVFRAEKNCLMRDFGTKRFCAVCTRAIRNKLAQLLGTDEPNV
ncbi:MAG TPA: M64 family metallopeptidase [Thermodesulfobacteriota bacterium]|nr:M64 family metallopeptidase [Thermodesulfobacteriota bacterium]